MPAAMRVLVGGTNQQVAAPSALVTQGVGLVDHQVVEDLRRFLFLSIGWPPLAEFPLDKASGSLHRRGLLRRRRRPPHQIATLLVLESVQKQKPGRVLGDSGRVGSLQHRLAEEIAGFVDAQFVFGLSPAFEGRGRLRRRVVERE